MTDDQSKAIETMRKRYLDEYRHIYKKGDRIAFFKEIGEMAAAAGASVWKKFIDGMSAWVREDMESALALFEEAIALDPQFAYPWNGKGLVLHDQKRYDEALAAYEKAIALDPEYAIPWYNKGRVMLIQKRYDEALAAYEKAIMLDPEFASPWNDKGTILRYLKRYDEALASYEKSITLDPEYIAPWYGKGTVLSDQQHYEEALAAFEKAITINPELAYPWNGKGNILVVQKRYDDALAAFEKSIAIDPEFAAPWNGKGTILRYLKRYDESLKAFEKSISLDPEYASPYYGLGLVRWEQGLPGESADAFHRAIDLGLESPWKEAAESWIERTERMIRSVEAEESEEEREQADRSSDEALVTDLFEAMKDDLPAIRNSKRDFKKRIAESVSRKRVVGDGADNLLFVLRDWNSFSPILRRDLRAKTGPGPNERRGGGYLLVWKGHGIVIDPGVDFVTQLYKKGLSIADIDTVVITHCHLDHTRDVESLVDLNYRFDQHGGKRERTKDMDFQELRFFLSHSALQKYRLYLEDTRCCPHPVRLKRGGDQPEFITDDIDLFAVPVMHRDIDDTDDQAIGLVFSLKEDGQEALRVGITSDSRWDESLVEPFQGCDVVVSHMGTIEVGDEKEAEKGKEKQAGDEGESAGTSGFLTTDLKNHLGTKGCFRLLHSVKPKVFVVGEFGEELVETRFKIIQVFHGLKPKNTQFVLGGDSNLVVGLGKELSVCCSHPECARSWIRIPLDKIRPVIGGDYLFQYICSRHGIVDE